MLDLIAYPDTSKVWIYPSDQCIEDTLIPEIYQSIQQFTRQWTSHQSALFATGGILHNYFIVFVVDDQLNSPGGCSIDKSVHFLQDLGRTYHKDFFNRMIFHYLKDDNIFQVHANDLKSLYADQKIDDDTLFFNPLVKNKKEFLEQWLVPFKTSWHYQFL